MTLMQEFMKLVETAEAFRHQFNVVATQAHTEMQENPDMSVEERIATIEMVDAAAILNQAMNQLAEAVLSD